MFMRLSARLLLSGVASLALFQSASASAQTSTAAPAAEAQRAEAETVGLTDIVVTANRREERLQDVPLAVTAIAGDALTTRGINTLAALNTMVPSFNPGRTNATANFYLRGVGFSAGGAGIEAPVAVFVDDVYLVSPAAAFLGLRSIERVEVLKGPQGTLFGRNATGGVVHVVTRDPEQDARVEAEVGYANYDTLSGRVYLSAPITDTFRFNLNVQGSDQRSGWGRNILNGEKFHFGTEVSAYAKLVWEPSERTYIRLSGDLIRTKDQHGLGLKPIPGASIQGCSPATVDCRLDYEDFGGFYNTASAHAATYSGANIITPTDPLSDQAKTSQNGNSLKIRQDLGFAQLVSITSRRYTKPFIAVDSDGGPVITSDSFITWKEKTWTQELQLQSPEGSAFSWIVGAYYLNDRVSYDSYRNRSPGRSPNTFYYFATQDTDSYAAFAQATAPIFDNTNLTLGARYTHDRREVSGDFYSESPAGVRLSSGVMIAAPGATLSKSWSKLTYRAVLDHHFTDDVMVYGSFNRGFKSGTYSLLAPAPGPAPTVGTFAAPTNPETLDAYALGLKSQLLDRRVTLNIEAFHYDYTNLQITTAFTGIVQAINAGAAKYDGVDIDVTAKVSRELTLTGAIAYLDGKYTKFPGVPRVVPQGTPGTPVPAGGTPICVDLPYLPTSVGGVVSGNPPGGSGCDLAGTRTIRTPRWSFNAGGDYRIPTDIGELGANLNFSYIGRFGWDTTARIISPPTYLLSGALSWTSTDERFGVSIWGQNLLDRKIYAQALNTGSCLCYNPAPPRTFGVRLSYKWDGGS